MLFIPISEIKAGKKLPEDVLAFGRSNVLLLVKGTVLTEKTICRMKRFGVTGIYVRDEITGELMPSIPLMDENTKYKSLKNLEWIFRQPEQPLEHRSFSYMKHIDETVMGLIGLIQKDKSKLIHISDLKAHDEYTYHHSLGVAVLAIAIGSAMKLSNQELYKLGFSAIMHDIGKMSVPADIINKPGELTDEEFEIVRQHPENSVKYLAGYGVNDELILESVKCHHEKLDGTGYPSRLQENQIPFFSKIIAVADVYDALTSSRSYRKPMIQHDVVEYMMARCGADFDTEIVGVFLNKVEFYPIGSFVELSDGTKAVVIGHGNQLRPIVQTIEKPYKKIDLFNNQKNYNLVILRNFDTVSSVFKWTEEAEDTEVPASVVDMRSI